MTAAMLNKANHRQRALDSLPSGNSRSRNTTRPMAGTQTHDQSQIDASPQGSDPGQQRVDGVLGTEVDHREREACRAE
jgi:hypothetical protein